LLPSGPGGVRRFSLRGAQPSTPPLEAHSTRTALEREFNPAEADCGLQGTANSPSSTATPEILAEGAGFEPAAQGLPVHGISSAAPSAARSPLRTTVDPASRHLRPTVERRSPAQALRRQIRLAEGRGFEPPRDLRPYPISSRTPSTGLGHPSAPTRSSSRFKEPSQQRRAFVGEDATLRDRPVIQSRIVE
jgi:hypothetical protein